MIEVASVIYVGMSGKLEKLTSAGKPVNVGNMTGTKKGSSLTTTRPPDKVFVDQAAISRRSRRRRYRIRSTDLPSSTRLATLMVISSLRLVAVKSGVA
jgi:hypothetical protein